MRVKLKPVVLRLRPGLTLNGCGHSQDAHAFSTDAPRPHALNHDKPRIGEWTWYEAIVMTHFTAPSWLASSSPLPKTPSNQTIRSSTMLRKLATGLVLAASLASLTACGDTTGQRALSGGAIGAGRRYRGPYRRRRWRPHRCRHQQAPDQSRELARARGARPRSAAPWSPAQTKKGPFWGALF
jgi:hypothetical protein